MGFQRTHELRILTDERSPAPPPLPFFFLSPLLTDNRASSWNARTCEFAFYLYLIESFPDTLVRVSWTEQKSTYRTRDRSSDVNPPVHPPSLPLPTSQLPASIYGLFCTGASILLAGWIGGLVDGTRRVRIVRLFTLVQKAS